MKIEISQELFNDLINLSVLHDKTPCEMVEYLIATWVEDVVVDSSPIDDAIINNDYNKGDKDIKKIVEMFKFGGIDIKI